MKGGAAANERREKRGIISSLGQIRVQSETVSRPADTVIGVK